MLDGMKGVTPNYRFFFDRQKAIEYYKNLEKETGIDAYLIIKGLIKRSVWANRAAYNTGTPERETCIFLFESDPYVDILKPLYKITKFFSKKN